MKKAFRPAFTATIPVLCGYLFIGFAFGVMLRDIGFGPTPWALLLQPDHLRRLGTVPARLAARGEGVARDGRGDDAAAQLPAHLLRSVLSGDFSRAWARRKWYMIFSLTDETYSLLCSLKTPAGVDAGRDALSGSPCWTTAYWIIGVDHRRVHRRCTAVRHDGYRLCDDHACSRSFSSSSGRASKSHVPAFLGLGCGGCSRSRILGPRQFHPARHARHLRDARGAMRRQSCEGGRHDMSIGYALAMIAVAAVCTFATRVAPFSAF